MEWWQIFLDILPSVVAGGFSFWLYKLNKRDKELSDRLEAQQKMISDYREEINEYKKSKQEYKKWLFEKRCDFMDEIAPILFSNVKNAKIFLERYGKSEINFAAIDTTELLKDYYKCLEDINASTEITYSKQFYIEKEIVSALKDFGTEMCKITNLYENIIKESSKYKATSDIEKSNSELVKEISDKSDKIIAIFRKKTAIQVTDLTELE
ncbi:MAG: hypothetical protein NC132_01525 [Corallococcus sp.]|nr:hypothetical protein [Corallococcus sp.]MCM1359338.1 hypothetical protein [Corallococcus sp.]MCM1394781.1 hypothetical protein [Corallococcus sp.]